MKRLGFLTGAGVAAIGVWAFYALTEVTDDDRLAEILSDHCLPYVTANTTPFTDLGRSPGVYDAVELRDDVTDGGARLLYNNRFVAQWGVFDGLRFCKVDPTYGDDTLAAFEVDASDFIPRYTAFISEFEPLEPDIETLDSGPRTVGWYGVDRPPFEGLRVVMVASPGLVSSVIAVKDLP